MKISSAPKIITSSKSGTLQFLEESILSKIQERNLVGDPGAFAQVLKNLQASSAKGSVKGASDSHKSDFTEALKKSQKGLSKEITKEISKDTAKREAKEASKDPIGAGINAAFSSEDKNASKEESKSMPETDKLLNNVKSSKSSGKNSMLKSALNKAKGLKNKFSLGTIVKIVILLFAILAPRFRKGISTIIDKYVKPAFRKFLDNHPILKGIFDTVSSIIDFIKNEIPWDTIIGVIKKIYTVVKKYVLAAIGTIQDWINSSARHSEYEAYIKNFGDYDKYQADDIVRRILLGKTTEADKKTKFYKDFEKQNLNWNALDERGMISNDVKKIVDFSYNSLRERYKKKHNGSEAGFDSDGSMLKMIQKAAFTQGGLDWTNYNLIGSNDGRYFYKDTDLKEMNDLLESVDLDTISTINGGSAYQNTLMDLSSRLSEMPAKIEELKKKENEALDKFRIEENAYNSGEVHTKKNYHEALEAYNKAKAARILAERQQGVLIQVINKYENMGSTSM